ncbi:sister chromatid cohesion 1 protein 3 [Abrus precatorius]|uniref:Sister chromatid cohesion 1 protein 3 n=1 Tax=Abrus precatorius TaxID=3816 RepID=A0A8B8KEP4_ABRPR|nr:sister chromatid cohesion 1 protein 3 [Abrus precatorius]
MFYSQTFLARKGPLSTVWIAAHLQNRLKKSHCTATHIPSTVQHIMDPGVPIALRMSGHLLLGVVRIYKMKVDYLLDDSNAVVMALIKALDSIKFAAPEDARQASFQAITLPETFNLDAVNLGEEIDKDRFEDVHMRSFEDITLTDQPVIMDQYLAISLDEDIMMDSSHTEVLPDSGAGPMEEDTIPQSASMNFVVGVEDHVPSTQRESPTIQHTAGDISGLGPGDNSPAQVTQANPIEFLRDPNNDHIPETPPVFPNLEDNDVIPNRNHEQTTTGKDPVPEMIGDLDPQVVSAPSQQHFGPPTPVTSQGGISGAQVGGENISPNFMLRESPPVQQPQRRGRKRKQFFDEPIVLSNRVMRGALNNPRDILRKRREVPSSNLGTWKLNNSRRKEHIFDQPLLTGLCKDLLDISNSEYVHSRPNLAISEEDHVDARITKPLSPTNQSPEEPIVATPPVTTSDMEIERLRNVAVSSPPAVPVPDVVEGDYRSPDRRNDFTMASPHKLGSISVASLRTNIEAETMQTPDLAASPDAHELETMHTLDSDSHLVINSPETNELWFLEVDSTTPASSPCGTSGSIDILSGRTGQVAQCLKRLSPITPILEDPVGDLSLNKILEGKTRKVSARMFFEILVLKTHGLVDVQQEEPYGDINLKLTSTLLNAQS